MTDNELAPIRARNAARTPGNWCVQGLPSELWRRICSESEYIDVSIYLPRIVHSQGNADFIAGASVDIPAMLAEIHRLRAGIHRIGTRAENWSSVDVQCAAADLLGVDASEFDYKEE